MVHAYVHITQSNLRSSESLRAKLTQKRRKQGRAPVPGLAA